MTASIGIAVGRPDLIGNRDLLRHADAALHRAKDGGRDRIEVFDDTARAALSRRVQDEQAVRRALHRHEFMPWYQPIVDATTGRIVGAELLARWLVEGVSDPVPAAAFIDVVAESGLMDQLSESVIERGLVDLANWERHGLPDDFRLSVNLPPRYTSSTGRVHRLVALLTGGPCRRLTVEVTESSVVDDAKVAARRLAELRGRGLTVALDDFGTGAASLTLLQTLPLDAVKIDRSFVTHMVDEPRDRALVRGFNSLAHDLGLSVTAEGVETVEQANSLLALGCNIQQGYLYGAAMPATAFERQMRTQIGADVPV